MKKILEFGKTEFLQPETPEDMIEEGKAMCNALQSRYFFQYLSCDNVNFVFMRIEGESIVDAMVINEKSFMQYVMLILLFLVRTMKN